MINRQERADIVVKARKCVKYSLVRENKDICTSGLMEDVQKFGTLIASQSVLNEHCRPRSDCF